MAKLQNYFSVITLLIANLVPLYYVITNQIGAFDVLLLYWLETAIIGFFYILRLLFYPTLFQKKVGLALFFCVHFGIFMFVHLFFILIIQFVFQQEPTIYFEQLLQLVNTIRIASFFLFISHATSFIFNYLGKKEYHHLTIAQVMNQPYQRVVVMHLAILFGWGVVLFFGTPTMTVMLLVIGKILLDLKLHLNVHPELRTLFSLGTKKPSKMSVRNLKM